MKCEICGREDIKNMGVHLRWCGKTPKETEEKEIALVADEITDKPLSVLISEIKNLIKPFRHEIDVRVSDKGGRTSEVEIRVRIQI